MPPKLEFLSLKAGDIVEMYDGSTFTVVDNPRDGIWLHVLNGDGEEESVDISEVKRLAPVVDSAKSADA